MLCECHCSPLGAQVPFQIAALHIKALRRHGQKTGAAKRWLAFLGSRAASPRCKLQAGETAWNNWIGDVAARGGNWEDMQVATK